MTLNSDEFLRRFLLHVLPRGLTRIRHFGLLANRRRGLMVPLCRRMLDAAPAPQPDEVQSHARTWICPMCDGSTTLVKNLTAAQILTGSARQPGVTDTS